MRNLAAYAMRGRLQAMMVASVAAALALLAPPLTSPLGYVGGGVVALVALRQSAAEGMLVMAGGAAAAAVIAWPLTGQPVAVLVATLLLWLPVWLVARVLRATVSLPLAMDVATALTVAGVLGFHALTGDPAGWWRARLEPVITALMPGQEAQIESLLTLAADWMTALVAAGGLLGVLLCLFLGRWWQAVLYNPGGFGTEFRSLRSSRVLALGALIVWGLTLVPGAVAWPLLRELAVVLVVPLGLAGLAVVHGLVAARQGSSLWLVTLYLLLVFASPLAEMALAALGLVDSWANFRRRVGNAS